MQISNFGSLVDINSSSLVDKSTSDTSSFTYDIALLKETKEYADIIELVNGYKPNIKELYYEMWFHD